MTPEPKTRAHYSLLAWCFALTIFVSAFLLFQVQPMMAKAILPWFGGTPAVWSTCLLFFQTILLAGYAYAHLLNTSLSSRMQALVHIALLVLTACFLNIVPGNEWKPTGAEQPAVQILLLLMLTVGLPYFLLSTTGPLLQSWFSMRFGGLSPYRLYALSNAGSLLALLSYPFLFEPRFSVLEQAAFWSAGYAIFLVCCCVCALAVFKLPSDSKSARSTLDHLGGEGSPPPFGMWLLWFGLAACGSTLLLAITNHVCQDIAVIPFLWIVPLSLYLLTFILCFESDRWYSRRLFLPLTALMMLLLCDYEITGPGADILLAISVSFTTLFAACMVCHGELARTRPEPTYLTSFYLMVSAGGAFGGLFVSIIAPAVFSAFFELQIGLLAVALLVLVVLYIDPHSGLAGGRPRKTWLGIGGAFLALAAALTFNAFKMVEGAKVQTRNFYGILRATELDKNDPELHRLAQYHGRIQHGVQYYKPEKRFMPTAYYREECGSNAAFRFALSGEPRRVGIIGLGTGTMAAFGRPGDTIRFYEINPQVIEQARKEFTYLEHSQAEVEVVLSDARLSLEREAPQHYDLFVIDAFSGDAIPAHLLTREAFQVYLKHLKPGGIMSIHVTNHHLDLRPVIAQIARLNNLQTGIRYVTADREQGEPPCNWMLLSRDPEVFRSAQLDGIFVERNESYKPIRLWTDDFSNLFEILK